MMNLWNFAAAALSLSVVSASFTRRPQTCKFDLDLSTDSQGTASVKIVGKTLFIKFSKALPSTLYTIWVDFRNRGTLELSSDYPLDTSNGSGIARGVAPAFAKTSPVFEGMRPDLNSVKTDKRGNAIFFGRLDYELLKPGDSPVVTESLTMQGENRVGGSWMREYPSDVSSGASSQVLMSNNVPQLVTATAQGLTIVGHFLPFTHGHTPGVGGVDNFGAYQGDFPDFCKA